MAQAKTAKGYSNSNQIDIQKLNLILPNDKTKKLDIRALLEELVIYEDVYQASMSASLTLVDQNNIVGELPIVGGETIEVSFATACYTDYVNLTFTVYKIGERVSNPASNAQMYELFLCTPEMYWASNNDISQSFKGTYKDIAVALLKLFPNGTKKQDFDATTGITTFVCPNWNIFKALKWCAGRSFDTNQSPFLFYEDITGYHLKSLKGIYDADAFKTVYLQSRTMIGFGKDMNKFMNTAYSYEYLDSNNRLEQYTNAYFGTDYIEMDFKTKKFVKKSFDYTGAFDKNKIHLNQFPLPDDMNKSRSKSDMVYKKGDGSEIAYFQKQSAIGLMDNTTVMVALPGDSKMTAGKVVKMDIPSKVGQVHKNEDTVSGKWLASSLKHLIKRNSYTQVVEFTQDSFAKKVRGS